MFSTKQNRLSGKKSIFPKKPKSKSIFSQNSYRLWLTASGARRLRGESPSACCAPRKGPSHQSHVLEHRDTYGQAQVCSDLIISARNRPNSTAVSICQFLCPGMLLYSPDYPIRGAGVSSDLEFQVQFLHSWEAGLKFRV